MKDIIITIAFQWTVALVNGLLGVNAVLPVVKEGSSGYEDATARLLATEVRIVMAARWR